MSIICLEGASAVGKSTTCKAFARRYHTYVVPETSELFKASGLQDKALSKWLLDRQIDRWSIAREQSLKYDYVILDGDIFKLWYDWVFGDSGLTVQEQGELLKDKIIQQEIAFPDAYVALWIDEEQLRARREADSSRTRKNFTKHLHMVKPQLKYFTFLQGLIPGYVGIHNATLVESNVDFMFQHLQQTPDIIGKQVEIFDQILHFYDTHQADQY
ncbi:chloramphenicol acetyltransferase [Paenibacillus sp. UMB4589-SE434]|uniref:chloramphenicol acetyltransferase n=1 Tax=Paenibacillus sp. UMB4589-SE434 TaxID=3046314 RepID=UPI00254E1D93|nr:chloramphenicol acetyltransferase [Paenibacillus sp. UMB4589-SE434]MDK8182324.1 chloramphenicol acetyltransferase [Paenibacillus sp. UMB4589-SE434]